MSTRSNISMELPNGRYRTIYCHYDGYPEHHGAILLKHYNTREKVEELLSHGNLSSLAEKINPDPSRPHTFDFNNRQEDVCVFYGRERGDEKQDAKDLTLFNLKRADWIEYFYIFTLNNEWKYYDYTFNTLHDLKNCFAKDSQDDKNDKFVKVAEDVLNDKKKKKHNSDEEM